MIVVLADTSHGLFVTYSEKRIDQGQVEWRLLDEDP